MKSFISLTAFLCTAPCCFIHATRADTITLKPAIRCPQNASSIKLADIATLEGDDALALSDLVVAAAPTSNSVLELSVREVRAKLDEAGIHWGRINLSGRSVVIRTNRDAVAQPPLAMAPVSLQSDSNSKVHADTPKPQAATEMVSLPTLRGLIVNYLATSLHVDAQHLRVEFDHPDDAFLDLSTDSNRFELQPLCNVASDRVDMAVRIWTDGKVQQGKTITLRPQMAVQAATAARDLQKDATIAEEDLECTEQWLTPSQVPSVTTRSAAVGRVAAKSMKAGEVMRDKLLRRDTLIKRGELAIVRCLVGGVAISLQAEAKADGTQGETIEFRKQGERETFLATVTSRGEAVIDLSHK